MSLAIEWEGTWADNGSKIHICEHVVKGFGTRRAKVNCEIGATSDGCGITVNFRGTSNPAGLILAGAGEWEKPGIIEKLSAELLRAQRTPRSWSAHWSVTNRPTECAAGGLLNYPFVSLLRVWRMVRIWTDSPATR